MARRPIPLVSTAAGPIFSQPGSSGLERLRRLAAEAVPPLVLLRGGVHPEPIAAREPVPQRGDGSLGPAHDHEGISAPLALVGSDPRLVGKGQNDRTRSEDPLGHRDQPPDDESLAVIIAHDEHPVGLQALPGSSRNACSVKRKLSSRRLE